MVAYSFKRRFVDPIRAGLGIAIEPWKIVAVVGAKTGPLAVGDAVTFPTPAPKRQTIRADRARHARPGEEVQLYCGMRTKSCFLIGRARCTRTESIQLYFHKPGTRIDSVRSVATGWLQGEKQLDAFARSDGFDDWNQLREFWNVEHDGIRAFDGRIIFWEPLP